ncbi:MAG TPA: type II CAAX endopeptidase family protein [Mucilaginibacter sp.]
MMNTKINSLLRSILFWAVFIGLLVGSGFLSAFSPGPFQRLTYGILGSLAAFLATLMFLKYEKSSFAAIGLVWEKRTLLRFALGISLGAGIFAVCLIILLWLTGLRLQAAAKAFDPVTWLGYLAVIPLALMEEIGFRAYPFLKLDRAFGIRLTQFIVAVSFALYHILNGWTIYAAFTGPFVWAFVFGLAAAWSKGIAMPTGIHVALNAGQMITGMSGGNGLWKLGYAPGVSHPITERTATVALLLQLAVLVCALALTEYYIRKKSVN